MTKNIIFDLGGVLLNLDMQGMLKRFKALGAETSMFLVPSDEKNTSTVCEGMSAGTAIKEYQVGHVSTEDLICAIQKRCRKNVTGEEITDTWNSCLGDLPLERLDAIKALRKKGYRTYMLSNTNEMHWVFIVQKFFLSEGYQCQDLFDSIFLSHEVNLAKPDAEIYRHVLKQIGSDGADCLFIDDSAANVEGAMNEGIPSLWLDLKHEDVITLLRRTDLYKD